MTRTYKFRLYPNYKQEKTLFIHFNLCRFTYNKLLEELSINNDRKHIQHHIVELKEKYPELKQVYAKTLQYECYRLFSNIRALSQSKKKGNKIGKLRFKGKNWFKTIVYSQYGFKLIQRDKRYNLLSLSKIGDIKILQSRKIQGKIKEIIIKKNTDSWEAHIITDAKYEIKSGDNIIGVDLGVIDFITDNNGNKIKYPMYLNQSLNKIKKLQKKLSKNKKHSKNRYKNKIKLSKLYEHITNQRQDFLHKITTKLINENKFIGIENLNVKQLHSISYNARNMNDCSWGKFVSMLDFKAESAGCQLIKINPKNTTRMCSKCKNIQEMKLNQRQYQCCVCDLLIDRDTNAAINILNRAMEYGTAEMCSLSSMKQEDTIVSC